MRGPQNEYGQVIANYHMSWQHEWFCICFILGIEEF